MKAILLISLFVLSAFATVYDMEDKLIKDLYQQWKLANNKVYETAREESYRFSVFRQNYLDIVKFNAQDESVTLGLNQFADLTSSEFGSIYTGTFHNEEEAELFVFDVEDLPTSVDWRTQGAVTPVKNQGSCGSCWAFSATGALEGLYFINNTKLVSFSEQQLVDCVTADQGCDGGLPTDAFDYTAQAVGIESEADYPYVANTSTCNFNQTLAYDVNSAYLNVTPGNATQMKAALVSQPVSVGIQANQFVFQFYTGGVIKKFCGDNLDHGVLVVGYDTIKDTEAFIVKNSWGASWGELGYVYIATDETPNKGKGVCGILSLPAFPTKN